MAASAPQTTPGMTSEPLGLGVARLIEQLRHDLKPDSIQSLIEANANAPHLHLVPAVTQLCQKTVPRPQTVTEHEYDIVVQAIVREVFRPDIVQAVIDNIRSGNRQKASTAPPAGRTEVDPIFPPPIKEFDRLLPGSVPPDISLTVEHLAPQVGDERDKNNGTDAHNGAAMEGVVESILGGDDSLLGPPSHYKPPTPTPNQQAMPDYAEEEVPAASSVAQPAADAPSPARDGAKDEHKADMSVDENGKEKEGEEEDDDDGEEDPDNMCYAYALLRTCFSVAAFHEKNAATKRVLEASWRRAKYSINSAISLFSQDNDPPPPKEHEYAKAFCERKNVEALLRDLAFFMPACFEEGELEEAVKETQACGHPLKWIKRFGPQKIWELVNVLTEAIEFHYADPAAERDEKTKEILGRRPAETLIPAEWNKAVDDDDEDDDDFEPPPPKKRSAEHTAEKSRDKEEKRAKSRDKFDMVLRGIEPDIDAIRQACHDGKKRYASNLLKEDGATSKQKKKKRDRDGDGEDKEEKKVAKPRKNGVGSPDPEQREYEKARDWAEGSALDADELVGHLAKWRESGVRFTECSELSHRANQLIDRNAATTPQWRCTWTILKTSDFKFKRGVARHAGPVYCSLTSTPIEDPSDGVTLREPSKEHVGIYLHRRFLTPMLSLHCALNTDILVKKMDPAMLARYLTIAHHVVSQLLGIGPIERKKV